MVVEAPEEHVLDYAESAYEDTGKQAPMGFMASRV